MILSNEDLLALLDVAYECGDLHRGKFYKHINEDNIEDYVNLAKLFVFATDINIEEFAPEPEPQTIKHVQAPVPVVSEEVYSSDEIPSKPPTTPWDYDYEDENDVYYCFYHFSKEDCEKAARRLVPHMIEEYPMIFNNPVDMKDIERVLCEDEPFIHIFFCNYRSMAIMLYRCFDFMTWENDQTGMVKIFYKNLTDSEIAELRAEGYHVATAIESYRL